MNKTKSPLGVAVVGCGTVGAAVATILTRDCNILAARVEKPIQLRHIVDIDFTHARQMGLDDGLFSDNADIAIDDPEVGVVVELIGGLGVAREVIEKAIRSSKHVVTANKALLAHHGQELFALARENDVCLAFEASCAGGIPIIGAINGGLIANRIDAIFGIVNGTCNFILSEMADNGRPYAEILTDAQRDGLAEADPTLDVSGEDSAHKLAILASLAFGVNINYDEIYFTGIDTLELCDVEFGKKLGYVIKLLAIAQKQGDGISLRVRPAFISRGHPLAWVNGPFNAVSVYGHLTGHTMYYGRGAGAFATGSAVVADIASIAMGTAQAFAREMSLRFDRNATANQLPIDAVQSRYYLRIACVDRPGVFSQIASILGRHEISISSVLQQEPPSEDASAVPVIITTHHAMEGNVRRALAEIDSLDVVRGQSVLIGIVEEHPEEM